MKKLLAMLLALSLLLSVTAVFAEGENTETAAAETETQADPVLLVTVFGEEITDQSPELLSLINNVSNYYAQYGYDTTAPDFLAYAKQACLTYMYEERLILNKAKELGMDTLSDEDKATIREQVSAEFEEDVEYYLTNFFQITDESSQEDKDNARAQLLALFEADGYTLEATIAQAEKEEIKVRVRESVITGVEASEQDILDYFNALVNADKEAYEENPAEYVENRENYQRYNDYYPGYFSPSYYIPTSYRGILHILLKPENTLLENWQGLIARLEEDSEQEEATDETTTDTESADTPTETEEPVTEEMVEIARQAILDSLKEKIDDIQKRLAAGESFESLIAEYGEDDGMKDEEFLKTGYLVHPESVLYTKAFTEAANALEKVGDYSEPIVTEFGVHILYYLRDVEDGSVELTDSLKAELKEALDYAKQEDAYEKALDEWIEAAEAAGDIVWTDEGNTWLAPEDLESVDDLVPED